VVEILDDLAAAGVSRTSLLVIPNHHHKAPMLEDAGFCRWLGEMAVLGHEVVLHGYYHQRPVGGEWRHRVVTEYYTAGEGEFFDLTEMEADWRLRKGLEEFSEAGLHPTGFIAPAWLLGENAERAVKSAGFAYTTRLKNFKDLASGRENSSQSLVWSVRAAWRRIASVWWNQSLAGRLIGNPLFRVGLHPPDWDHPAIREQVERLIAAALAGREVMTYEDWLARCRAQ
jgi:predicted deacetylase